MKHIYLSYSLANEIPVYGGRGSLNIKNIKSLHSGYSANVFSFTMENHWGTHVDAPNHFFENGLTANDYPANFWFFKNPMVMRIDLKQEELLGCSGWTDAIKIETDIILFKSGWNKFRGLEKYSLENPGIHPEVGFHLRENCPNIKAIGIDWISISSFQNRELGRQVHRSFLDPEGSNNPILIIEDMDLSHDLRGLREVWAAPQRVEGIDSAPCTVIGVIED